MPYMECTCSLGRRRFDTDDCRGAAVESTVLYSALPPQPPQFPPTKPASTASVEYSINPLSGMVLWKPLTTRKSTKFYNSNELHTILERDFTSFSKYRSTFDWTDWSDAKNFIDLWFRICWTTFPDQSLKVLFKKLHSESYSISVCSFITFGFTDRSYVINFFAKATDTL